MTLDALTAPSLVSWQLTRACDLACRHCCTDSAPGRALPNELTREEALCIAADIAAQGVPKVVLCGGEPLIVPHFFELAQAFGRAGVSLKVETNGQRLDTETCELLSRLPIVSVQVSLDGDTAATYARVRLRGRLDKALAACRAVVAAGLPLEITYAPTRLNLVEAEAVIERAVAVGAFRINTGMLMRLGTASRNWERLEPTRDQYAAFFRMLRRKEHELRGCVEVAYRPWSLAREAMQLAERPPATLLVLPDGRVKVCAALPYVCGDLRRQSLAEVWGAFRDAWRSPRVADALAELRAHPEHLSRANHWLALEAAPPVAQSLMAPQPQPG